MKKMLFLSGGWDGHRPGDIVQIFAQELRAHGLEPVVTGDLSILAEVERLREFALIFPCWTMGRLTDEQHRGLVEAVRGGVGLAGV
ncbi:MAG: hypothetical protein RL376_1059, partial [Verrucomicrobiota bacterium]